MAIRARTLGTCGRTVTKNSKFRGKKKLFLGNGATVYSSKSENTQSEREREIGAAVIVNRGKEPINCAVEKDVRQRISKKPTP